LLTAVCIAAPARITWAAPGDVEANRGLAFAKRGDCVKAVPLLEEAELKRHRPHTALALADCYVALGELLRASELYHATAEEKPARTFTWWDRIAIKRAKKKAEAVDKRIPTLAFALEEDYEDLEVELDGRVVADLELPRRVPPDVTITITARAKGYDELTEELVLNEGERRVLELRLTPLPPSRRTPPKQPPPRGGRGDRGGRPTTWLGAGYQGFVIPQFLFGLFGEGGHTLLAPGAELALTVRASDVDLTFSVAYASFRLGETPFKPSGSPDTDWEIIESDLQALIAAAHLAWNIPLNDAGTLAFRVGGGLGVGWTFLGNLFRTQAYPPKGAGSDPYLWQKCEGPNDPAGTFVYCNQLDYDADHYFGYTEPSWFAGGKRPLLFPWIALPELGLAIHPTRTSAIDLQVGLSLTGLLTGLKVRFGL
jgi:hypothetical protein